MSDFLFFHSSTYLCRRSWVHVFTNRRTASRILLPSRGSSWRAVTKSRTARFFLSFRSICIHWWCSSFSWARSNLAWSSKEFRDFLKFSSSSASRQWGLTSTSTYIEHLSQADPSQSWLMSHSDDTYLMVLLLSATVPGTYFQWFWKRLLNEKGYLHLSIYRQLWTQVFVVLSTCMQKSLRFILKSFRIMILKQSSPSIELSACSSSPAFSNL